MVAFLISAVSFLVGMNLNMATGSIVPYQQLDDSPRPRIVHQQTTKSGKRIGILSIHVAGSAKGKKNTATVKSEHFPHILNKACYSHLWGYDYFFKTSWSYDPSIRNESSFALGDKTRCWLDIGNWHRVPVLKAMLSSGRYDWVVWTDADMVFNDLAVPIETLLKDFELHNKTNVHVVHATHEATRQKKIPRPMIFSSFGLMIRNSEYGHRVLDNWLKFAMGLCPNGNHPYECNGKYEFANSDQVGLWYASPKTYSELQRPDIPFDLKCSNETGYIENDIVASMNYMHEYFEKSGVVFSNNWSEIPDDQPILFSAFKKNSRSIFAIDQTNNNGIQNTDVPEVFAVHKKSLPKYLEPINELCRKHLHCYVGYGNETSNEFMLGCGNTSFVVSDDNFMK